MDWGVLAAIDISTKSVDGSPLATLYQISLGLSVPGWAVLTESRICWISLRKIFS